MINRADALQQRLTAVDERADVLEGLLREVSSEPRHPDYDWNLETQKAIDAALKPAEASCNIPACDYQIDMDQN